MKDCCATAVPLVATPNAPAASIAADRLRTIFFMIKKSPFSCSGFPVGQRQHPFIEYCPNAEKSVIA
jgi:hypothetical protein